MLALHTADWPPQRGARERTMAEPGSGLPSGLAAPAFLPWLTGLGAGMVFLSFLQKLLYPYFWSDLWYLLKVVRCGLWTDRHRQQGELVTVLDKFLIQAKKQPQKPFIIYEGDIYTYEDVDRRSNKVAHVFRNHSQLKRGDTVALLMSNEPDFIHVWFGLAKLGCVVAFLNSNVRSISLLHCIRSCEPRALVVGAGRVCEMNCLSRKAALPPIPHPHPPTPHFFVKTN